MDACQFSSETTSTNFSSSSSPPILAFLSQDTTTTCSPRPWAFKTSNLYYTRPQSPFKITISCQIDITLSSSLHVRLVLLFQLAEEPTNIDHVLRSVLDIRFPPSFELSVPHILPSIAYLTSLLLHQLRGQLLGTYYPGHIYVSVLSSRSWILRRRHVPNHKRITGRSELPWRSPHDLITLISTHLLRIFLFRIMLFKAIFLFQ